MNKTQVNCLERPMDLERRLRKSGQWADAIEFRETYRAELRLAGKTRRDASVVSWQEMADRYAPAGYRALEWLEIGHFPPGGRDGPFEAGWHVLCALHAIAELSEDQDDWESFFPYVLTRLHYDYPRPDGRRIAEAALRDPAKHIDEELPKFFNAVRAYAVTRPGNVRNALELEIASHERVLPDIRAKLARVAGRCGAENDLRHDSAKS